jgi:hypothetical protein
MSTEEIHIHIQRPRIIMRKVESQHCPTCELDQAFLIEHHAWYGQDATCLVCGDRWQDGEMCPRPFARGWRRQSVEHALKRLSLPVIELTAESLAAAYGDDMGSNWNPKKWRSSFIDEM